MKKMVCELCGSNDFSKDNDGLFVCDYCRTKYTPEQAKGMLVEGTVRLDRSADLEKFIRLGASSLEHSNAAEAYDYANKALEIDTESSEAWFIKAKAAGWSSNLAQPRYPEMIGAFEKAINFAPEEKRAELRAEAADQLNNVAVAVHRLSLEQVEELPGVDSVWEDHIERTDQATDMFFQSYEWGQGAQPLKNVVEVSSGLFNGPTFDSLQGGPTTRTLSDKGQAYFREKINRAAAILKELDENYEAPQPTAPTSSACFVVTATMGNEHSRPVEILREFREVFLRPNKEGQKFIAWYNQNGPLLASRIEASRGLTLLSLILVVVPATVFAKAMLGISRITNRRY